MRNSYLFLVFPAVVPLCAIVNSGRVVCVSCCRLRVLCVCYQVELHVLALANVGIGEERVARKMIHRAMVQVQCNLF